MFTKIETVACLSIVSLLTILIMVIAILLQHSDSQTLLNTSQKIQTLQYTPIENLGLFHNNYKEINYVFTSSSTMPKITKDNKSINAEEQDNTSSLPSQHQPPINDTNEHSGKFKKFGNFTQILQGTRLGFNDTASNKVKDKTLMENENKSGETSEFTP